MADELIVNAEFGKKNKDEEDPILVAQRYLNIWHQIHIFNQARRQQFDEMLLALQPEIRVLLNTLPGGSVLLDHIEELELQSGVDASMIEENAVQRRKSAKDLLTKGLKADDQGSLHPTSVTLDPSFAQALSVSLAKAMQQQQNDMKHLASSIAESQVMVANAIREALAQQPARQAPAEKKTADFIKADKPQSQNAPKQPHNKAAQKQPQKQNQTIEVKQQPAPQPKPQPAPQPQRWVEPEPEPMPQVVEPAPQPKPQPAPQPQRWVEPEPEPMPQVDSIISEPSEVSVDEMLQSIIGDEKPEDNFPAGLGEPQSLAETLKDEPENADAAFNQAFVRAPNKQDTGVHQEIRQIRRALFAEDAKKNSKNQVNASFPKEQAFIRPGDRFKRPSAEEKDEKISLNDLAITPVSLDDEIEPTLPPEPTYEPSPEPNPAPQTSAAADDEDWEWDYVEEDPAAQPADNKDEEDWEWAYVEDNDAAPTQK